MRYKIQVLGDEIEEYPGLERPTKPVVEFDSDRDIEDLPTERKKALIRRTLSTSSAVENVEDRGYSIGEVETVTMHRFEKEKDNKRVFFGKVRMPEEIRRD